MFERETQNILASLKQSNQRVSLHTWEKLKNSIWLGFSEKLSSYERNLTKGFFLSDKQLTYHCKKFNSIDAFKQIVAISVKIFPID